MDLEKKFIGVLRKQFKASFNMIKQGINNVEDFSAIIESEWSYAMTLYHIIETAEFYIGDSPETMKWGHRAGINWEEVRTKEEPHEIIGKKPKSFFLDYLEQIEKKVDNKIQSLSMEDLLETDDFKKHGFQTRFYKYLYLLRHNMHHIGELNKSLRSHKLKRIMWE